MYSDHKNRKIWQYNLYFKCILRTPMNIPVYFYGRWFVFYCIPVRSKYFFCILNVFLTWPLEQLYSHCIFIVNLCMFIFFNYINMLYYQCILATKQENITIKFVFFIVFWGYVCVFLCIIKALDLHFYCIFVRSKYFVCILNVFLTWSLKTCILGVVL